MTSNNTANIKKLTLDLLAHCHKEDWSGWDPYDALSSKLFQLLPFIDNRISRLVMIQSIKRCPINLRRLLLVPKKQNPKALALFLSAIVKLYKIDWAKKQIAMDIIDQINKLRSPSNNYWCWGYSFPWQTRTLLVPSGSPNLVCTTFVANALLDAYEAFGDKHCLDMAVSAAEYIATDLYYTEGDSVTGYCYPTQNSRYRVHNANFLGAALLCRVDNITGKAQLTENALKVARYSASKQKLDGSWDYGEHPAQGWIDNFHTGYNLCALRDIFTYTEEAEFEPCILKGFQFYVKHFFKEKCVPKYFHNRDYPLDIHCVAQSIITLIKFKDLNKRNVELANNIYEWAVANMWDKRGYFYYQIKPHYKNKIPYIRWAQAWMLYALAIFLSGSEPKLQF